jgi:hypothetical protein
LKEKIPEITGLQFTHPDLQDDRATEIWIKFKNEGVYAFINFEHPFPEKVELQKLVGAGNALNCSEYKKDELIQYTEKSKVIEILDKSIKHRGNMEETVLKTKELFVDFPDRFLYYKYN